MVSLGKARIYLQNQEAFTENVLLQNISFSYIF